MADIVNKTDRVLLLFVGCNTFPLPKISTFSMPEMGVKFELVFTKPMGRTEKIRAFCSNFMAAFITDAKSW